MPALDAIQINFDSDGLLVLNIALAVVMFGVALDISLDDFKNLLKQPRSVLLGIASQFILLPLFTFFIILLLNPPPSIALGMMMIAACPGGNISNFMTHLAKGNTALSVSLTAFATFLGVFLTPVNFQFYASLYAPTASLMKAVELDPFALFRVVLLILGIPLVLGMLVRSKYTELASVLSRLLRPVSILVFIAIVVVAFSKNLDIFFDHVHHVLSLGILHNLFAIGLGYAIASLFKLSFRDRKTLAIETGIQNSGLGLLLIFTFFEGLGGMALIAAFWGMWHIISGLLLATYWSKKSDN